MRQDVTLDNPRYRYPMNSEMAVQNYFTLILGRQAGMLCSASEPDCVAFTPAAAQSQSSLRQWHCKLKKREARAACRTS